MLHNVVHGSKVGLRVTLCGVCGALLTVFVLLIHSEMEAQGAQNTNVPAMMPNDYVSVGFEAATTLEVGIRPDGVTSGDFNGDGMLDLAVANEGTSNVFIFLGTGTGSFSFHRSYSVTGPRPQNVIAADLNNDGRLDLAVPNNDSNTVSILLGYGTGDFINSSDYDVGAAPHPLAAGDFNGDGNIDLAVPNQNSNTVSILLGYGTGKFLPASNYTVGAAPRNVAIADFNGDGKLDIATANILSANVSILLGTGNGSFLPATSVPVVSFPSFVESGDFNGDGKVDLAVPSYTNQISILLGTGTGSFSATANSPQVSGQMQGITIADLNSDGHLDLVADNGSSSISIFLGTGTGSFGAETRIAVGSDSFSIAAKDFNGDGRLDLAIANYASGTVSVLLNTSSDDTDGDGVPNYRDQCPHTASSDPVEANGCSRNSLWIGTDNTQNRLVYNTDRSGNLLRSVGPVEATGFAIDMNTSIIHFGTSGQFGRKTITARKLDTLEEVASLSYSTSFAEDMTSFAEDMTFDGSSIWRAEVLRGILQKINPSTGNVESSLILGGRVMGVAWDGSGLWVSFQYENIVKRFDVSGNFTGQQFTTPFTETGGLAWDPTDNTLWVGTYGSVYHYKTNGEDIGHFSLPDVLDDPRHFVDGLEFQGGVSNHPPMAVSKDVIIAAGSSCSANASIDNGSSDPDGDQITLTQSPAGPYPIGITSVVLTVTDSKGASRQSTSSVTVFDSTPPSLTPPPSVTVYTGPGATAYGATVSDATLENAQVSDNCSGSISISRGGVPANSFFPVGTTVVTYTAIDAHENTATATQNVTVIDNTPPQITAPADLTSEGNIRGSCGSTINPGTAMATDNGPSLTVAATRSDGQNLTAPYPAGITTIMWTARDGAGNVATSPQHINVTNSVPSVAIKSPVSGAIFQVGTPVPFTGSFTDNPGGVHTATWLFDTIAQPGIIDELKGSIGASFAFTAPGIYLTRLTLSDGCGGTAKADTVEELQAFVVVFDPNGGFVTGGGWINSLPGAYPASPGLTGKGSFGFVSAYQNGAALPTGQTEFQFRVANLNFHSIEYQWLVIAGARAQFKGSGTINGSGDYGFMLTAIDGQVSGGGGVDKFRIKIWDKASSDAIVYDNQLGDSDNGDPVTAIGEGSIVIHKQ
jgi:hypothetical protein